MILPKLTFSVHYTSFVHGQRRGSISGGGGGGAEWYTHIEWYSTVTIGMPWASGHGHLGGPGVCSPRNFRLPENVSEAI